MRLINIVVNPSYSKTNWFRDFCLGVRRVLVPGRVELCIRECGDDAKEVCKGCLESSGIAIVVSSSEAWESRILRLFSENGVHSVVIRPSAAGDGLLCSSVSIDYYGKTFEIMKYLFEAGHRRIAFLGYNKDSSQDNRKYSAYKAAYLCTGLSFSEDDVYENTGSLEGCVSAICRKTGEYDAILCANDVVAASLVKRLGVKPLVLASFGNTRLLKLICPGVISVSLSFEKAGDAAGRLYLYLAENRAVSSAEYIVSSDIEISCPEPKVCEYDFTVNPGCGRGIAFYEDAEVVEAMELESALSCCDELDMGILECILGELTYEQIAEKTNTAVTTVKYRLKKIYRYFNVESRSELTEYIRKYTGELL